MKYIAWAVVIVVCFILGKVMYAPLGPALLSDDKGSGKAVDETPTVEFGAANEKLRITIDLTAVDDSELPESVTLHEKVSVSVPGDDKVTILDSKSEVRVVKRSGSNLEIAALSGPLRGTVAISGTDFAQRVIEKRVAKIFGGVMDLAQNTPPVTPPTPAPAEPGPEPAPPVVVNTPDPAPAPEPAPAPVPEPEPAPEPAPAPAGNKLNPEQIVALMQASIKAGKIQEFTFEKVTDWKGLEEEETIDGEAYQIGLASYLANTIFGEKPVNAKALIQGGEIKKWIYEKTGMEIR